MPSDLCYTFPTMISIGEKSSSDPFWLIRLFRVSLMLVAFLLTVGSLRFLPIHPSAWNCLAPRVLSEANDPSRAGGPSAEGRAVLREGEEVLRQLQLLEGEIDRKGLTLETFQQRIKVLAFWPVFNERLKQLTMDPVLRFKVREAFQDLWLVSTSSLTLDSEDLANRLRELRTSVEELLDPNLPRSYQMGLSDEEWDRLLSVQEAKWQVFEPFGRRPLVDTRYMVYGTYVPTYLPKAVLILKRAGVKSGDHLLDLGSGLGHALGAASGVLQGQGFGYELHEELFQGSVAWVGALKEIHLVKPNQIQIRNRSFLDGAEEWPDVEFIYYVLASAAEPYQKELEQRFIRYGKTHPVRLVLYNVHTDSPEYSVEGAFPLLAKLWTVELIPELNTAILTSPSATDSLTHPSNSLTTSL